MFTLPITHEDDVEVEQESIKDHMTAELSDG